MLLAAKETQATEYDTEHNLASMVHPYSVILWPIHGVYDGLQGPDGHPGDVGERGLPGTDGDKVNDLIFT